MKKLVLILYLVITSSVNSQALYPGNVMLDVYTGFPNFGKALLTSGLGDYQTQSLKGIGPLGFRAEYLVDDNLGVGLDLIYNAVHFKYQMNDTIWFGDVISVKSYDYHSVMERLRIQFRMNYHFEHDNPRFDSYFGFGLGYNNRTYFSTKNNLDNTEEFKSRIPLLPFPVSARICYGGRYYFSQYVGLSGEVGLGGPLISVGIAFKY